MLKWMVILVVISILASLLGFTVLSGIAATLAKILLVIFFILLVIFIVRGITGYRRIGR
jgi:uncharacterized membrane protein YtjA (UPF0391 family)